MTSKYNINNSNTSGILCHIVGMNNIVKQDFIKYIEQKYSSVIIIDIDKIVSKIRNNRNMKKLKSIFRRTINRNKKNKYKKEMYRLWKISLDKKLNNTIKKNTPLSGRGTSRHINSHIILIGLCTHYNNHRYKIHIDTKNKSFVKVNAKKNAQEIILYNLDKYRKYIINGTFILKYIDFDYIVNQRNKLNDIYINLGYKNKSLENIKKWIDIKLKDLHTVENFSTGMPQSLRDLRPIKQLSVARKSLDFLSRASGGTDIIYVSTSNEYNNIINVENSYKKRRRRKHISLKNIYGDTSTISVIGYTQKWLSLLSSIPNINDKIKKGFLRNSENIAIPYVEEKYVGALDELKIPCYIYKTNKNIYDEKIGWYKYKSNKSVNIIDKRYIFNIYDELKENSVKMIKYKTKYSI
uniref:Uncharacterized protein n=1 Tax=Mimivirus LCMiAC02 TaxID=2506609 RepID=A0A481Z0R5_9VIRU|nr:MAG: uncharacterized protein LCMiAC02_01960 [Mimivirus LCMiAC02]